MRTHFAEILAREGACLAGVTDGAKLAGWRRRVVEELMTPRSPYALALRQTGDVPERADFLGRWRGFIEEAVDRLLQADVTLSTTRSAIQATSNGHDVDPHKTAVLILAALHGGSTLSQIAQDPWPLNAALDIALAPLGGPEDANSGDTTTERANQ
ncbi:hypothetical protein EV644_1235 [Kribbella orskensis]|uniref:TetR family transcriptional regulator n=1 Tax=Kribbella orskensis TaxID=2512216 RepID=A0ABY2BAJ7_9ACTN|nr:MULTISPECIES: hypothetical protein [Kribbella]TCN32953.1 hypothetical protein EV642_125118 [Kribbella sp. VKM Ac-2500]TCO13173.1 hypothetical protein EV644_1235 [Kribbella orskensis]